jgi:hypothetical protein
MDVVDAADTTDTTNADKSLEKTGEKKEKTTKAAKPPAEKAPDVPFFINNGGGFITTYLYDNSSLPCVAHLVLDEMTVFAEFCQSIVDKMTSENKSQGDIAHTLECYKQAVKGKATCRVHFTQQKIADAKKSAKETGDVMKNPIDIANEHVPEFESQFENVEKVVGSDFKPNIYLDMDVDREVLKGIADGKLGYHKSLANAFDKTKTAFPCDQLSEIGARRTAGEQHKPIACLAYGSANKVSSGGVDSVFGIEREKSDGSVKRFVRNKVDEQITAFDAIREQSGFNSKVTLYNREMDNDITKTSADKTLEQILKDAFQQDHELKIKDTDETMNEEDKKEKEQKDVQKKKTYDNKMVEFVKKNSEKVRNDVRKRYCEITESNIAKAAKLKLSRTKDGCKPGDKKYDEELEKLMAVQRKELKTKLLEKDDPRCEEYAKEIMIRKLRTKRLKKSKITCKHCHTSYTPTGHKCPNCSHVHVTNQQSKLIEKTKKTIMNKYSNNAQKWVKKGLVVKIYH